MAALHVIERTVGNADAEAALCGALMCDRSLIDGIADRLSEDHFSEPLFARIYGAIVHEHSLGRVPSAVTLRPYFADDPQMAEVGGPGFLATLTANSVFVIGARDFADQIIDLSKRRRLIEGLREAIAMAEDQSRTPEQLVEAADEAINVVRDSEQSRGEHSGAECLDQVIQGFDRPMSGVTCGNILSIDQLLGPMRPTHFIIGAGRPGMGKTATAISYALGAASRGHGVLFVSLEMGASELGERMAADLCLDHRIPYDKIRDRALDTGQIREVCRARDRLADMPLQIVDRSGLSIAQLRTIVRRWGRRFAARGQKLELVIVDYLQLMRAGPKMDRYEAVTEISRSLKEIAKENDLAVFALAQLSREVEKRADKRPILADLRDSGQIEQDADGVLFFLREEYYLRLAEPTAEAEKRDAWEAAMRRSQGRIEFICAKRRNGQTGSLTGDFLYHFQAVRG